MLIGLSIAACVLFFLFGVNMPQRGSASKLIEGALLLAAFGVIVAGGILLPTWTQFAGLCAVWVLAWFICGPLGNAVGKRLADA